MRLISVTTCTDRKRFEVLPLLNAATLPPASQGELARAWRWRVQQAPRVGPAMAVYGGRSFQEALDAARTAGTELRIISGGLGLVTATNEIPAYSLSLVRQSAEFIGARVSGASFDVSDWWCQVQDDPAPLATLLHQHRDAIVAIAISSTYLPYIAADLQSVDDATLGRIRLLGMSIEGTCPVRLRPCVLPYDDRIDGPDSNLRGTRGDFAARALRHFTSVIFPGMSPQLDRQVAAITQHLAGWRRPAKIARTPKSDEAIVDIILQTWRETKGQSARALRHLRDRENVACEQGRFRTLFQRAASQVNQ